MSAAVRQGRAALPAVDRVLREAGDLIERYGRALVTEAVRETLAARRTHGEGGDVDAILADVSDVLSRRMRKSQRRVFNLTGTVLHTNLGRAPLPEEAIEAAAVAMREPTTLEYETEGGRRGERDNHIAGWLTRLTGAEAALAVNNNAGALVLALNALAAGKETIVSRGELIEIGGAFRLPDIMARAGTTLREVGTTNRTHPSDYADAIGAQTALLLKVHPSNYRVVGFTSEVTLEDLVEIGRARGIDVMEDLGAGALIDLTEYGIPREPVVRDRIAAGAAIVTFSGDKLLGGPQAGLIVGRRAAIDRIKRNPLKRALRCDKLTLAALAATMRLYLRSRDLGDELPTLRILRRSVSEIGAIAPRAREIVAERLGAGYAVEIVDTTSQVGSGAMPVEELKSVALRVSHPEKSANAIAAMFRRARIIGRVTDDSFHLDLRTIEDPAVFAVKLETD